MPETFVSGASGFIGGHLISKIPEAIPVPHKELANFNSPYRRFFFCSAYGNMANHYDSGEMVRANVTDLISIINAGASGFDSLVYISSSSVGLERQTFYSRTKKAGEQLCIAYKEGQNYPIAIIRPFSVTGVGEQRSHLIPTLIRSCLTGEAMNFVPEPTHDFVDVDDLVNALILVSAKKMSGTFEVGSGISHTNQQVREIVERVTGNKAQVTIVPSMRSYDNENWVSTNLRIRTTGWLPRKTLEQSISEMVEEFKKHERL